VRGPQLESILKRIASASRRSDVTRQIVHHSEQATQGISQRAPQLSNNAGAVIRVALQALACLDVATT